MECKIYNLSGEKIDSNKLYIIKMKLDDRTEIGKEIYGDGVEGILKKNNITEAYCRFYKTEYITFPIECGLAYIFKK